jgi:hypothetical protein
MDFTFDMNGYAPPSGRTNASLATVAGYQAPTPIFLDPVTQS